MSTSLADIHKCLDKLEESEVALLAWGDTGGYFSRKEVISILKEVLPSQDSESILEDLVDKKMLFEVPHPDGIRHRYRTRMGEATFLYRNLRQWFYGRPLFTAKTLVSDFRFARRPRSYPSRAIPANSLIESINQDEQLSGKEILSSAIKCLLGDSADFTLSGFQQRAVNRVLHACNSNEGTRTPVSGTIICAGTGSGKTIAFYLPALATLVKDILSRPTEQSRVRVLAIYPRNELLKDQFMEAWAQCRKLDGFMLKHVGRKVRIGALFGLTPDQPGRITQFIKPFSLLRCPTPSCSGESLNWSENLTKVRCGRCGHTVGEDEVALTRKHMFDEPPDILFTTTEMLNQRLTDPDYRKLFGVGVQAGPIMVLLDEVHTYSGSSGAQNAYLFRRWLHMSKATPHFVGLSATLVDAARFFSDLIGVRSDRVAMVEALPNELVEEGAEYLMVLRGDPVSQTALLSTTIQASMLTRRMLDPKESRSAGTWGQKLFVFTDDLDATNRLYYQLADAEGWYANRYGLRPKANGSLANLRGPFYPQSPSSKDRADKARYGQDWSVAQEIGHSLELDAKAYVGRTSSQDAGVEARAEIVVATAALEVGFNDPSVGAVIQHKAPRDVASYLQRKGRAGRSRMMRPWMLVILSEFGRDRVAFQRYEELLSPEIKRQALPLHNAHIQKMQAAMALLDWISKKISEVPVWEVIARANKADPNKIKAIISLLDKLVCNQAMQADLKKFLGNSLRIEDSDLNRVLWGQPRSVLLEVVPALKRKLTTNFSANGVAWAELSKSRSPLPEYIPAALFAELNLPSVSVRLLRGQEQNEKWEVLPIYQGLREFAPGRISKRYAIEHALDADWLVPPGFKPEPGERFQSCNFEIEDAFGSSVKHEGIVELENGSELSVVRPGELLTTPLPREMGLTERSNSRMDWSVRFVVPDGASTNKPPKGAWSRTLQDVTFFLHSQMLPLQLYRFSSSATANLRYKSGQRVDMRFRWMQDGRESAIGVRQWVDGMCMRFSLPSVRIDEILLDKAILASLRPLYFRELVGRLEDFRGDSFKANWVAECYLACIGWQLNLGEGEQSIEAAIDQVNQQEGLQRLRTISQSLFQLDEASDDEQAQKLQVELEEIFSSSGLIEKLKRVSKALHVELNLVEDFTRWVRRIVADTMASSVQRMLCILLPDVDERLVLADPVWTGDILEVWLTEADGGGSGVISRLEQAYFDDPMRFLGIFERSALPSDYEQIDTDIFDLLSKVVKGGELADAIMGVRNAEDMAARRLANAVLKRALIQNGFLVSHSFMSVLHSRVLRPQSGNDTDQELLGLLTRWRKLEEISGVEWDLNIAAHTLATCGEYQSASPNDRFREFCRIQGLLWPRGHAVRASELNFYSPFAAGTSITERLVAERLFGRQEARVDYCDGWRDILIGKLSSMGVVELFVPREAMGNVTSVLADLLIAPIEMSGLWFYPRISSLYRIPEGVVFRVEIAEVMH